MAALRKPVDSGANHRPGDTTTVTHIDGSDTGRTRASEETAAAFLAYLAQWEDSAAEQEATLIELMDAIDSHRLPGNKVFSAE